MIKSSRCSRQSQCFFAFFFFLSLQSVNCFPTCTAFPPEQTTQNSLSTQLGVTHACVGKPTGSLFFPFCLHRESYLSSPGHSRLISLTFTSSERQRNDKRTRRENISLRRSCHFDLISVQREGFRHRWLDSLIFRFARQRKYRQLLAHLTVIVSPILISLAPAAIHF